MKRWTVGLLAGILVISICLLFFIPNKLELKASTNIRVAGAAIHRVLLDKNNVAAWWPGSFNNGNFQFNDFTYQIHDGNITVVPVSIVGKKTGLVSSLFITSISLDSTQLQWIGSLQTSYNPIKRFTAYLDSKKISRDMSAILQKMERFYSDRKNIYGIDIKKTLVVDSLLISTAANTNGYPTTEFIYSLVNKLSNYAEAKGAKQHGFPMLNVVTSDSLVFEVKVAIPTNIPVPSSADIFQKRMPGRSIILFTQVKGGIQTTAHALDEMKNYADDHHLRAPAIPFYSLVTDRREQPDSSQWITDVYFPVMIYPE